MQAQSDEIRREILRQALTAQTLVDLEKAASALKLVTETDKLSIESTTLVRRIRYDRLTAAATVIVPFLSLLTVAFTVWLQTSQLTVARESNEDSLWRDSIKVFSGLRLDRPNPIDTVTANTLLKPFFLSPRYSRAAREASLQLLGKMTNIEMFKDLYEAAFQKASVTELPLIVAIDRQLYANLNELDDRLEGLPKTNAGSLQESRRGPSLRDELNGQRNQTVDEIVFTSGRIADLVRTLGGIERFDLSAAFLMNCDLSGVTFRRVILRGTKLQNVAMTSTRFVEIADFEPSYWVDVQWWKAAIISKELLFKLLDDYYPYSISTITYSVKPDKVDYETSARRLCQAVGVECNGQRLKFGVPAPGTPSE